jgi:hypothetical protein
MPAAMHTKAAADHSSCAAAHQAAAQQHTAGDQHAALASSTKAKGNCDTAVKSSTDACNKSAAQAKK